MNRELNGHTESAPKRPVEARSNRAPSFKSGGKVKVLTTDRLIIAVVIGLSVLFGLILPFLPLKGQAVMVAIFPALIGGFLILFRPYLGIYGFYFYEYFRPDYFWPMVAPLRLALIVEVVTLLAWVIHLVIRRAKVLWHRFNWVYIAFVAVIGSTVLTAANNRFAYDTFQAMLITFIVFVIATNVLDSLKRLRWLVFILMSLQFYFALKGIQEGGRVGGPLLGDENDLALFMNTFIPFAYFFFIGAKRFWSKSFYLLMLMSSVFATIVSLSRGGTVGLLAVILYCIAKSKRKVVGFSVVLLLGVGVLLFAPDKYWEDARTITDTSESTAQSRLNYWAAAVRMFVDYPITGVGAGNGPVRMPEYYHGARAAATQWGRTFHGTLPQVLAELGALGIGAYLFMFVFAVRILRRIRRQTYPEEEASVHKLSDSIMGGLIGFMVTGTFLSTAYYPQLWSLYLLTLTLYHVSERIKNRPIEPVVTSDDNLSAIAPGWSQS